MTRARLTAADLVHPIEGPLPSGFGRASVQTPLQDLASMIIEGDLAVILVTDGDRVVGLLRPNDILAALHGNFATETTPTTREDEAASPALSLKLRRMATDERLVAEFPTFADAEQWLRERPVGLEVLGVVQPVLTSEQERQLHDAMRPISDEERALRHRRDAAVQREHEAENERLQREGIKELSIRFSGETSPSDPDASKR